MPSQKGFKLLCAISGIILAITVSLAQAQLDRAYKQGTIRFAKHKVVSDDDFPNQVYFHNPIGITFDGKGNLYVSDAGAHNIKKISPDGRFLKTIGQEGAGPGDLKSPSAIEYVKDRLVVWESTNRRLSLLSVEGEFIGARKFAFDGGFPLQIRGLPDGRIVLGLEKQTPENDDFPQEYRIDIYAPDLMNWTTLCTHKQCRTKRITSPGHANIPQPYNPRIHWDVTREGKIVVGYSDSYALDIYEPDGTILHSFGYESEPVRITQADKDNHFSRFTVRVRRGNAESTKQEAPEYIIENTFFPDFKPAFDSIRCDGEGHIWVHTFMEDRAGENQHFDAFAQEGRHISRVQIQGDMGYPFFRSSRIIDGSFWMLEQTEEDFFVLVQYQIGSNSSNIY